ncbi:reverse transcriptase domain-containing protein [Tanacetum coccineum]|uniref:Reverse transcriptase domain-containing protein n=1 Tax=Tanacetum coccineum TaxID=301880 RepID=A0ABQ5GY04_9ASTR
MNAFGLCNAPATFQRCMTAIFHELIEDIMEVFMDGFSVFGNSFDHCLKNLEKMLKRCEETNLVSNWEKCHFMVKEGIVLGHKVLGSGIEVDKAKIKAISKLPYPTNVKAIRSFLGHAGFYRRFIKDFSQIARPMTQLLVKDAPFNFSEECIQAFDTLKHELTQAPIMIKPDWSFHSKLCATQLAEYYPSDPPIKRNKNVGIKRLHDDLEVNTAKTLVTLKKGSKNYDVQQEASKNCKPAAIWVKIFHQNLAILKFLRSLPSEWNTHVVVWRNKPDLDTISFDDLYNNFKIVEQEVKGTASSSSSSSSQNMAFVSSPSSTNEVNTAYGVSNANTQVSPASTQVSTAST